MRTVLFILLIFFYGCQKSVLPPQHTKKCNEFYDLRSEQCDTYDSFIKKIESYSVIFIGDHHDCKALHVSISKIITKLAKRGYNISLANEWFTPFDNKLLREYTDGIIGDEEFQKKIEWKKKSGYPFDSFAPIYRAVIDANASLYGINLTKKERKLISEQNLSAMSEDLRLFYDNLDLNTSSHKALLAPFFQHCHSKKREEDSLTCKQRMYRVQVAWDSKMAQESAKLAKKVLKTKKDKLIVFAGAFHLESHLGINMRFARHNPSLQVTLLPYPKPQEAIDMGYSDFVLFYDVDMKSISKNSSTSN
jgi:uncharacterized iron-regulated protein